MVIYERAKLKDLKGAARAAKKRRLLDRIQTDSHFVRTNPYPGAADAAKRRVDEALQELHDAGELPLCNTCGREIGWDGLSLGSYVNSGGQVCGDCRSDARDRSLRGE